MMSVSELPEITGESGNRLVNPYWRNFGSTSYGTLSPPAPVMLLLQPHSHRRVIRLAVSVARGPVSAIWAIVCGFDMLSVIAA